MNPFSKRPLSNTCLNRCIRLISRGHFYVPITRSVCTAHGTQGLFACFTSKPMCICVANKRPKQRPKSPCLYFSAGMTGVSEQSRPRLDDVTSDGPIYYSKPIKLCICYRVHSIHFQRNQCWYKIYVGIEGCEG